MVVLVSFLSKRAEMLALDAAQLRSITDRLRDAGCIFAEEETVLLRNESSSHEMLEGMLARRVNGEPLETILGWASFCGLRIAVDSRVFIPRPRSELLVRAAIEHVARTRARIVLDMCCGSGAIGAAIAAQCEQAEVYAADIDPNAVACARKNLAPERVYEGALYAALPQHLRGRIELIVANAPYVPNGELALMPREARLYEPQVSLSGGDDGLDIQRGIAGEAGIWLRPGGAILVETSRLQCQASAELLSVRGFRTKALHDDGIGATAIYGMHP